MDAVTDHPYQQLPSQNYRDQLGPMVALQQVVGQTTNVANSVSSIGSSVSPTIETSAFPSLAGHWTPTGKYQQQHHIQNNNNSNSSANNNNNNNNNNSSTASLACSYSPQASEGSGGGLLTYDGQQFGQFLGAGILGDVVGAGAGSLGQDPEQTSTVTNQTHSHQQSHHQQPQHHQQQQHHHHHNHHQHHQQPHHHQHNHNQQHHQHQQQQQQHHQHQRHHQNLTQQELTAVQEQQLQDQQQQQHQHYGTHNTIDSTTLGPSGHGQGGKKSIDKGSDEYKKRRERNNVAVRKSREKAKMRSRDTERRVAELAKENQLYRAQYEELRREFNVLKSLLLKTGLTEQVIEEEAHGAYPILASQHHQQTRVVSAGLPPHPSSSWLE